MWSRYEYAYGNQMLICMLCACLCSMSVCLCLCMLIHLCSQLDVAQNIVKQRLNEDGNVVEGTEVAAGTHTQQ